MSTSNQTLLPGTAGPRPTLPTGGRLDEVSHRRGVLQSDADSPPFYCCLRPPRFGRGPTVMATSAVSVGLYRCGDESVEQLVPNADFATGPSGAGA